MNDPILTRRDVLKTMAVQCLAALPSYGAHAGTLVEKSVSEGWVVGHMTGAEALTETLRAEGAGCVFGIPGAQDNELWDTFKSKGLDYLLVTHEASAAGMADGWARSTGRPGVLCVVPGPGVTNALTGLGEALLDSIPLVAIVCDVARGEKYRSFQVHDLPNQALLQPVTKGVFPVSNVSEIPLMVRQAFQLACSGEPGPTAVLIPYPFFIEKADFRCPPLAREPLPFDETVFKQAIGWLSTCKRVGIYAGLGCMNCPKELQAVADLLQAPVATSVSGKGVFPETHPLAVGWGYGPQGTRTAERTFGDVDLVLAIGVRYSEVSTAYYAIPEKPKVIQVDINANNLGKVVKPTVCVQADAGCFLARLQQHADAIRRCPNPKLVAQIASLKRHEQWCNAEVRAKCGVDPMALILSMRRCLPADAMLFVDVTASEHWAAEAFTVCQPRTYFNPTDNQSMGWSIPAAIGAQRAFPDRAVATLTGDGCFLMSAMEMSTAARLGLPVKFFILDDQTYHLMQALQKPAYLRTTATVLAHLDYAAFAKGLGLGYCEVLPGPDLDVQVRTALHQCGPVLVRVAVDYGDRPVRWIKACKAQFTDSLTKEQKMHFLTRLGCRALQLKKCND